METTVHGARLHYERAGAGIPLILLHAGVADQRMWRPQIDAFAARFDVITPDMRGFGRSELPDGPWSPTADLLGLIDTMHLKPAHLVGCSMGAELAIDFALEHGERISKLVLVGPSIGGVNIRDRSPDVFADLARANETGDRDLINRAEARLWLDGPRRPEGYVREPVRSFMLEMNGANLETDFSKATPEELDPPAIDRLGEITAPTLVIIGDQDVPAILECADALMANVPHSRLAIIDDAAHLPNLEHPDEFNRIVLDFLNEA